MPELIDKAKLLEYLSAIKPDEYVSAYGEAAVDVINHVEAYVAEMPTIEAEPVRHGRWIPTEYDSYADGAPVWDKWECSECGHEHNGEEDTLTAFCPDCGSMNSEV